MIIRHRSSPSASRSIYSDIYTFYTRTSSHSLLGNLVDLCKQEVPYDVLSNCIMSYCWLMWWSPCPFCTRQYAGPLIQQQHNKGTNNWTCVLVGLWSYILRLFEGPLHIWIVGFSSLVLLITCL
jgi:hypothetical protein